MFGVVIDRANYDIFSDDILAGLFSRFVPSIFVTGDAQLFLKENYKGKRECWPLMVCILHRQNFVLYHSFEIQK